MNAMEAAITGLVQARQQDFDPRIPPVAGPRALLKARLAEAAQDSAKQRARAFHSSFHPWAKYAAAALAALLLLALATGLRPLLNGKAPLLSRTESSAAPSPRLTPGDTIPVTREDVCRVDPITHGQLIPTLLKRQVFEEYGIANPGPDEYEVDYLITPDLGGATNIRNLWPQPYYNTTWHARVKDQLEERLHSMVCSGEIDLATAQHEIASNWIAAYKKYFHTEKPIDGIPRGERQQPDSGRLVQFANAELPFRFVSLPGIPERM
jgi:hypothetical protein